MTTIVQTVVCLLLIGFAAFYFRVWHAASERKYKYGLAINKRKTRLQIRKDKAERLIKHGPPSLFEQALCSLFDQYINHTFPLLNQKKQTK